jgi:ACT domain-containing protein
MTPADKLVWKILKTAKPLVEKALGKPIELAEDSSDDDPDEKISRFDFSNNYYKYRNSVKRFNATSEEMFWLLRYRSMIQEQVEEASLAPEEE